MNYLYANTLVITSIFCLILGVVAWSRKSAPGAKALAVIMAALSIWSFAYGMRWLTEDAGSIRIWINLAYTGIVIAPPSMLIFAHQFTFRPAVFSLRHLLLAAIEPVITLIFIWTDPQYGFLFGNRYDPNSALSGESWFWVNVVYTFMLMLFGVFLLVRYMGNTTSISRNQTRMILAGYLIPIVTCAIEILSPYRYIEVDLTPFTFLISSLLVMRGFFKYNLLEYSTVGYAKLAETSPDGMVVLDPDLRIMDMNPEGRELFEPFGASIGSNASEVFSSWPAILTSLKGGQDAIVFIKLNRKTIHDYDVSIIPFKDRRDIVVGWFIVFHDITYLKQTEAALTASENKIRSLFQAITDIVLILDRDGRYLEIAPTKAGLTFRDPMKFTGTSVNDVFEPQDAAVILDTIHNALDTGEMTTIDYPLLIEGQMHWYSGNASPLTKDTVIWVARDITERRQSEQYQRENRKRLELAQKISRVGSWECDLSNETFWASDEFYRIMGMDPAGQIHTLDELIICFGQMKYSLLATEFKNWIKNPVDFENTMELVRPGESQSVFLHSVASTINDTEGRPYMAAGVIQDITAQKQVEVALEKRMLALTRPLENPGTIEIEDLFNLTDLQKMQDDFAFATGVGSLITKPDGTPITRPSNFCRLCGEIIRQNETGAEFCTRNDAELCEYVRDHSKVTRCKSIGLLHAGAPIIVGGQHIASWLIGQVRTERASTRILEEFIGKTGLNRDDALAAFQEIPEMSKQKFEEITRSLYTFSSHLSSSAFQNIQQARFITERKKAEEALKISENKLRSLFNAMTDVIIIYDSEGNYREVAQTNTRLYTRPPDDLVNKSIKDTLPGEISSQILHTIQQVLTTGETIRLDYNLTIDGNEHWFSANVSPFTDDSVIWVARDITYRKKVEDQLHFQSMHDILTGLYNRQYYEAEIKRLQRSRQFPISMIVMDVDGLKWVNDHYGHSAGDDLLKRVSSLLKSCFRPEDMVARMGGDEFVVILPETNEITARQAVDRLQSVIAKHNELFPDDQNLSLSIGFAVGNQEELLTEVFKQADRAMYLEKGKKKKRNNKPITLRSKQ